jgi:hypothetical protein
VLSRDDRSIFGEKRRKCNASHQIRIDIVLFIVHREYSFVHFFAWEASFHLIFVHNYGIPIVSLFNSDSRKETQNETDHFIPHDDNARHPFSSYVQRLLCTLWLF